MTQKKFETYSYFVQAWVNLKLTAAYATLDDIGDIIVKGKNIDTIQIMPKRARE